MSRNGKCPVMGRVARLGGLRGGEDVGEELINNMGFTHREVMVSFGDNKGWAGIADGKDLIPGPVDMKKGLRNDVVLPFGNGADGPGDELVVA